jgi:hypothetical protein
MSRLWVQEVARVLLVYLFKHGWQHVNELFILRFKTHDIEGTSNCVNSLNV